MMKVMIADDELKVCRLIHFLVDWNSLDMEVVATVHNGIEALKAIEEYRPDLIITDIKMPGCDGLKMIEQSKKMNPSLVYIVISGYKQFEYAKKAIQHGVSNYLLKPIDKEELIHTLKHAKEQYVKRTEQMSKGERLEVFEQESKERARKAFFEEVLFKKNAENIDTNLNSLNQKYQYYFQEGRFQTAAIKVDGLHELTQEDQKYIGTKIIRELEQNLNDCWEWETSCGEGIYYLIANYPESMKDMKERFTKILGNLSLQRDVLKDFEVSIGLGEAGDSPAVFEKGFKSAKWALDQRLVLGTNQVIQGENKNSNAFVDSDIFREFNHRFYESVELQDQRGMKEALSELEERLKTRRETTGYEILQMCKEAVNVYLFALKNLSLPTESASRFFEKFHVEIHNCGTAEKTFAYLNKSIFTSFEEIAAEKQMLDVKPVRLAKIYIAEHLGDPISLESVSDVAGFNPAYFSTVFKKETGSTFSEYLLTRRMEKAKELLRESRDSVANICVMVGYSDVKHFTKNFMKYTSLKPKEYRKLYS